MRRSRVVNISISAGVTLAVALAVWNLVSGPSLFLWGTDATAIIVLTVEGVLLLTLNVPPPAAPGPTAPAFARRRAPTKRMLDILNGAEEGYTHNRREAAKILRTAVESKLPGRGGAPPGGAVDECISRIVGQRLYEELFDEEAWKDTKVKVNANYTADLREGITLLQQSLAI